MKEKRELNQPELADCWEDASPSMHGNEAMELLWENGRAVVRSAPAGTKKSSPLPVALSSIIGKPRDEARDSSVGKGLHATHAVTDQEDEMVPWLNHPFDDYYPKFFAHVPGVDLNSLSATVPDGGIFGSCGEAGRSDAHVLEDGSVPTAVAGRSKPSRARNRQTFIPSTRPKESDLTMRTSGQLPTRMQLQDLTSSSKLMRPDISEAHLVNFPHFTRPVALVKSNLQFVDKISAERAFIAASSDTRATKPIESTDCLRSDTSFHGQLIPLASKEGLRSCAQPTQEPVCLRCSEAIHREDAAKNSSEHDDIINAATNVRLPDNVGRGRGSLGVAMGKHKAEVHPEPFLAFPSMCSANGAGGASSDAKSRVHKRKSQGGEDSSEFSEDLEDSYAMGGTKPLTRRGERARRRRATDVHNLSERRRGSRINEKMRALQRLIPNCTKADTASMLDEAMEYMKTLQMQVQIMSMYCGMCMLPMMLPSWMQHTGAPRAFSFPTIGMGMAAGAGSGFGMGMLDMSGSPGMPVLPVHRPQYSGASIAGTAGLLGMPGSTHLQMFGLAPGQAAPVMPLMERPEKVNTAPATTGTEVSPMQATKDSARPDSISR